MQGQFQLHGWIAAGVIGIAGAGGLTVDIGGAGRQRPLRVVIADTAGPGQGIGGRGGLGVVAVVGWCRPCSGSGSRLLPMMYGAVESVQPLLAYSELFAAASASTLATGLP